MIHKMISIFGMVLLAAGLALVCGCASTYPQQEMDSARSALNDARRAGAPRWASEEYRSAEAKLEEAERLAAGRESEEDYSYWWYTLFREPTGDYDAARAAALEAERLADIARKKAWPRPRQPRRYRRLPPCLR